MPGGLGTTGASHRTQPVSAKVQLQVCGHCSCRGHCPSTCAVLTSSPSFIAQLTLLPSPALRVWAVTLQGRTSSRLGPACKWLQRYNITHPAVSSVPNQPFQAPQRAGCRAAQNLDRPQSQHQRHNHRRCRSSSLHQQFLWRACVRHLCSISTCRHAGGLLAPSSAVCAWWHLRRCRHQVSDSSAALVSPARHQSSRPQVCDQRINLASSRPAAVL